MSEILKKLPTFTSPDFSQNFGNNATEARKKLMLTNSKYDLHRYLGNDKLNSLIDKENVEIIFD